MVGGMATSTPYYNRSIMNACLVWPYPLSGTPSISISSEHFPFKNRKLATRDVILVSGLWKPHRVADNRNQFRNPIQWKSHADIVFRSPRLLCIIIVPHYLIGYVNRIAAKVQRGETDFASNGPPYSNMPGSHAALDEVAEKNASQYSQLNRRVGMGSSRSYQGRSFAKIGHGGNTSAVLLA